MRGYAQLDGPTLVCLTPRCEDFRYYGNMGWSGAVLKDVIKLANPGNPSLSQESGTYHIHVHPN